MDSYKSLLKRLELFKKQLRDRTNKALVTGLTINRANQLTKKEILDLFVNYSLQLGKIPTQRELNKARTNNKISFSCQIVRNRFGSLIDLQSRAKDLINQKNGHKPKEKEIFKSIPLKQKLFSILSEDEEKILFQRIQKGDQEAKDIMVLSFKPLVYSIANKYITFFYGNKKERCLVFDDLVQVGFVGLIEKINGFELKEGDSLARVAGWAIRERILRTLYNQLDTIRIGDPMKNLMQKYSKSKNSLNEKQINAIEKAIKISCTVGLSNNLREIGDKNDDFTLMDVIPDEKSLESDLITDLLLLKEKIEKILLKGNLTVDERFILEMFFGFHDDYTYSVTEIAEFLKTSRSDVHYIKNKALKKLCSYKQAKDLFEFIKN